MRAGIGPRFQDGPVADLAALTLAYEEPKYSILLRIIEEYVDSHQDDVEKGLWRMSHYDPEGWDDEPADGIIDRRTNEDRGTVRTFQRCRPVPDAYHYTHIPPYPSSETRTWLRNLSTRTS